MNDIVLTASKYTEAGLSVIPVSSDTKAPLVPKNVDWKSEKYTGEDRIKRIDEHFKNRNHLGIGVCCGSLSGNLYVFDFDNHFNDAKEIFTSYCNINEVHEVIEKLSPYVVGTKSGGYHLCIKTKIPHKTEKLARRWNKSKNKAEAIIESKAEGGYVVTYPTKGYTIVGGNAENIPELNELQFDILYSAALCFNEYVKETENFDHSRYEQDSFSERPGDVYNSNLEGIEEAKYLLRANGWKCDNSEKYWTRPDKKNGISATFGKVAKNVFYNFSSSASIFEDRRAYKPFQILALLKFNSNFSDAAKYIIEKYNLKSKPNPVIRRIYNVVRDSYRKGQKLSGGEINDLAEVNDIPVDEVNKHVEKAEEKYKNEFDFDKKKDIEKAEIFLQNNYEFRFNVISKLTEMRYLGEDWQDINVNTVYRSVQHEGLKFKMENLKSLLKSNFVETYNPFQEYFQNLSAWNKIDHISQLCSYIECDDDEFFNKMFEKALVRTIACTLIPEYYNRLVFVLQAEGQEIGKSYFIMYLNPFGTKYYTDEPLRDNKDSRFALTENFIYNLEELDGLTRMELSNMKATISTRGVKDRVAYGTHKEYFPRCCSLWGSTNRQEFLNDDKNTRWLIFKVKKFDWSYSKKINIHDVWSQAWHLFNDSNYKYDLTQPEASKRDRKNEDFRVIDYEYSLLTKNFAPSNDSFMTNAEIFEAMNRSLGGVVKLNTNAMKLGKILSTLGYERMKQGNQRGWKICLKNNPHDAFDKEPEDLPF